MEYIYIGNIVNTHGIKGEVRIVSEFEYKNSVFKKGNNLYIGKNKEKLIINTYRVHKMYDMVTFDSINDINDVLGYKGEKVYIDKNDINVKGYFDEDYIGLMAYTDHPIGEVTSVIKNKNQKLIVVSGKNRDYYIPKFDEFIREVDLNNKILYINEIPGLIDED